LQDLESVLISNFKEGTVIGEKGLKMVSLNMIFSKEITGAYKEGDRVKVLCGSPYYMETL
jgi:hypothetical protein